MNNYSMRATAAFLLLMAFAPASARAAAAPAPVSTAAIPATTPAPSAQPAGAAAVAPLPTPPRAQLTLYPRQTVSDRTITEDTVWRGEVVVEGTVAVAPQATLTIEGGSTVHFRKTGETLPLLMVQGRLVVQGTKDLPVLLASSYAEPASGDWQGIVLLGTEKKNSLEHCRIVGAETALEVLFSTVTLKEVTAEKSGIGMKFQDALVAMDGGGANNCGIAGVLANSEATLSGVWIQANGRGMKGIKSSLSLQNGIFTGNTAAALIADSCRIKVQGGEFRDNGSGITLVASEGSVAGASVRRNREFGLSLSRSRVRVTGNEISGNHEAGMVVEDGLGVAWGNAISNNGTDVANTGSEEFRAPGNWWGGGPRLMQSSGQGRVSVAPVLRTKPVVQ